MTKQPHPVAESSQRTLNDIDRRISPVRDSGNGWHIKATAFPSGDVEVMAIKLTSDDRLSKRGGGKRKNTDKDSMDEVALKKSQQRAKRTVRHKLLTMQADRLLTLTYRENMTDVDQGWKDLHAFSRKMKHVFGDRWQYVCVPELQKRGAVHFHLAIKGFYPVNLVRKLWRTVIGEGNIDITDPGKYQLQHTSRKNAAWNPKKIANYLSKYITKNETVAFNRRRYSSTKIELPEPLTGWVAYGLPMFSLFENIVKGLTRKSVTERYETDGYFQVLIATT